MWRVNSRECSIKLISEVFQDFPEETPQMKPCGLHVLSDIFLYFFIMSSEYINDQNKAVITSRKRNFSVIPESAVERAG